MTALTSAPQRSGRPAMMLTLATVGFMVNFWAWALLSPLGPGLKEELELSYFAQAILIAVPVLIGSVGRIPVGALTDHFGARVMFPAVSLATVIPVLALTVVESYIPLILVGFVLGIGGTAFAVGVPLVAGWYPPARRGFALGVFGIGMGGTAIANFTTVWLRDNYGEATPFLLVAAILVGYAAVAAVLIREPAQTASTTPAPSAAENRTGQDSARPVLAKPSGVTAPHASPMRRTAAVMRLSVTWQMSALYAVGFGGFVAFSVYLPTYLRTAYDLGQSDAALRTAGFVILAVAARPLGGWLSDRFHPVPVLVSAFSGVAGLAIVQAFQPPLMPLGTIACLGMAGFLGAAAGAVFALLGKVAPPDKVGAVTGVVGAAGGLGGFVPPLVMGAVYGLEDSYAIGLMLLSDVALAAAVYTGVKMSHLARPAVTDPARTIPQVAVPVRR